jgi:uncharacterized OB-fold protein
MGHSHGVEKPSRLPVDPRPNLVVDRDAIFLAGGRCMECDYVMSTLPPRCPRCHARVMVPQRFGPLGSVWTSTVLRIPTPGRPPPVGLAYVDLDEGPRILVHTTLSSDAPLTPGQRVRLVGWTDDGDPLVAEDVEAT